MKQTSVALVLKGVAGERVGLVCRAPMAVPPLANFEIFVPNLGTMANLMVSFAVVRFIIYKTGQQRSLAGYIPTKTAAVADHYFIGPSGLAALTHHAHNFIRFFISCNYLAPSQAGTGPACMFAIGTHPTDLSSKRTWHFCSFLLIFSEQSD